jgi:hypothetical protein
MEWKCRPTESEARTEPKGLVFASHGKESGASNRGPAVSVAVPGGVRRLIISARALHWRAGPAIRSGRGRLK